MSDYLVINDSNASHYCQENGYGLIPRDFAANPYGSIAPEFSFAVLPWNEIRERHEYNKANKSTNSDILNAKGFVDTNQSRTLYCWMHGCVNGQMATRIIQNQPHIELSAASAAAPVKNFANRGGWGGEALEWLAKNGVATFKEWPANEIDRRYYTDEMKAVAKQNLVTEWEDVPARDMQVFASGVVQNLVFPVAFNWWSHLILGVDIEFTGPTTVDLIGLNSHDQGRLIRLEGRKAIPDDAQVIRGCSTYYQV